jgi:hypothetical protein
MLILGFLESALLLLNRLYTQNLSSAKMDQSLLASPVTEYAHG